MKKTVHKSAFYGEVDTECSISVYDESSIRDSWKGVTCKKCLKKKPKRKSKSS